MKKVLLLGAFAALFIACDKNDMDEDIDVTQELTIENTIVVEDEVGFNDVEIASFLSNLKQPKSNEASRGLPGGFNDWYAANGDIIVDDQSFGPPQYGVTASMSGANRWSNYEMGNVRRWWSRRSSIWSRTHVARVNGVKVLRLRNLAIPPNRQNYYNQRSRNEITSKMLYRRDNINGKRFSSEFTFIVPRAGEVSATIWQNKIEGHGAGNGEDNRGLESLVLLARNNTLDIRFRTGKNGVYGVFDAGLVNNRRPKDGQSSLIRGHKVMVHIEQKYDNGTGDVGFISVLVVDTTTGVVLRNTRRVGKTIKFRRNYNRASLRNGLYTSAKHRTHVIDFVSIAFTWFRN